MSNKFISCEVCNENGYLEERDPYCKDIYCYECIINVACTYCNGKGMLELQESIEE